MADGLIMGGEVWGVGGEGGGGVYMCGPRMVCLLSMPGGLNVRSRSDHDFVVSMAHYLHLLNTVRFCCIKINSRKKEKIKDAFFFGFLQP